MRILSDKRQQKVTNEATCHTSHGNRFVAIFIENVWLLKDINKILQQQLVVDSDHQVRASIISYQAGQVRH